MAQIIIVAIESAGLATMLGTPMLGLSLISNGVSHAASFLDLHVPNVAVYTAALQGWEIVFARIRIRAACFPPSGESGCFAAFIEV